jgi:hypothetical protein
MHVKIRLLATLHIWRAHCRSSRDAHHLRYPAALPRRRGGPPPPPRNPAQDVLLHHTTHCSKIVHARGGPILEATLECCVATRKLAGLQLGVLLSSVSVGQRFLSICISTTRRLLVKTDTYLKVQFPVYHSWSRI